MRLTAHTNRGIITHRNQRETTENAMATSNGKDEITKDERTTIINAMDMLITSLVRSQKAAKGQTIAKAFEDEAAKARALQAKIASGKLDL